MLEALLIMLAGVVGGTLIGAVGVGGVIILPLLIGIGGMLPQNAIQLTLAGFVVTGIVALLRIKWRDLSASWPLLVAAVPGAIAGTIGVRYLPPILIVWMIAALAAISTIFAMLQPKRMDRDFALIPAVSVSIGLVTGFGSALTGSGGPLILAPILALMRVGIRQTIILAQVTQFPIALTATVTQIGYSPLNLAQAGLLAAALILGLFAGMTLQGRLPSIWLTRITHLAVLATVIIMLVSAHMTDW